MAILASMQSGNFTDAATWAMVNNTSYFFSEVGSSASTTSFVSTGTFTPGAVTIDGIGLRLLQTSGTLTGTFSVRLFTGGSAVAGTTVTINVTDLPLGTNSIGGWTFFKFPADVTLLAATSYTVQLQTSSPGTVSYYRDGSGTLSRFLRTTTTAAPAATDTLIVTGEYTGAGTSNVVTVTMNNTAATNFGSLDVGAKGILEFGTTAATDYQLRLAGMMYVTGAGTFNIGTLVAPMPASSSGILRFVNSANVDFGMQIRGFSVVTTYGETKIGRAYLNANAAATTIITDVSTGWLLGDAIVLASTTTTAGQSEERVLTANAVGTTVSIPALGFAHTGTGTTKAELINLTRNVKILGTSTTLQTFVANSLAGNMANISFNFTEFQFLGSNIGARRGVDISVSSAGNCVINGCAFRNFEVTSSIGINTNNITNVNIQDCVFYRMNTQAIVTPGAAGNVQINNCWAITNIAANSTLFNHNAAFSDFTNITAVSATGFGITITMNNLPGSSINNLTCHSNSTGGISIQANSQLSTPPVISNLIAWKNNNNISIISCNNIVLDTLNVFSASSSNITFNTGTSTDIQIKNATINSGTSPTAFDGIRFAIPCDKILVINSDIGIGSTHPSGDINCVVNRGLLGINFYNCQFGSTTEVTGLNNASYNSYITSSKHDGVSGQFRTFTPLGVITKDSVIFDSTYLGLNDSTRLTPTSVASKLSYDKVVAVPSGRSLKIRVAVRRSVIGDGAAYNGALPQLVVKKNHSIGLLTDTVLATATAASSGAFEFIFGTTPVATDNGAFTFCVTGNGTTGFFNVDSWIVEVI